MARRKTRKLSKKEEKAAKKSLDADYKKSPQNIQTSQEKPKAEIIEVPTVLTVREFADKLRAPVTEVIATLIKNGVMATINDQIDFDTMAIIGDELGFEIKSEIKEQKAPEKIAPTKKNLLPRPPVVTVMGHVDHGKTKLLDAIRQTDIISTEAGGITQHIGAYQVMVKTEEQKPKTTKAIERIITFLDTPGHEAFSAMRAHGANITDIVVLVVAANDGVKPQTIEAINHAKVAKVPLVVALNKIDLPDADIQKTKRQLADNDLAPEEWGGKTPIVEVSAKTGKNIKELLETILLVADLAEFKADPGLPASGVVIESHMQSGRGPIATVLVQEGTLRVGEPLIIGQTYGKIRLMENYLGKKVTSAGPSTPVRISGLASRPKFGARFLVVHDEKTARELTRTKTIKRKVLSIGELSQDIKEGNIKELKIVLKADVSGSLEAIANSLKNLADKEVKINIIHQGVGDISESDINMAVGAKALVIGFKVKASPDVMNLVTRENVKISLYEIIYQLLDDLTLALSGLLEPEFFELEIGRLEVLAVFRTAKQEKIIGGKVIAGKIENGAQGKIVRDKETIGEGKIISLEQNKKDTSEVAKDFECGLKIQTPTKILVGDTLEAYKKEERVRKLGE
ncbi:MAG: translation initiation factor IF-2 [Patescibacteria group bacterium]